MRGDVLKHPAQIATVVGGEPQFGTVGHDLGQAVEGCARHDPALVLPALWPGIRKQDEDAADRASGQRRDYYSRVIGKDPDIVEPPTLDLRQQLDDPVLENLAADKPDIRVPLGQLRQMLAGAETDFEPNRAPRGAEECVGVEMTALREAYRQAWQQPLGARLLRRARRPPAAATENLPAPRRLGPGKPQKARRSSSTKSSLSHEKLPSGSGLRPKWP
jgi:hypothetical protein